MGSRELLVVVRGRSQASSGSGPGDVALVDPSSGAICGEIKSTVGGSAPLAAAVTPDGLIAWVGQGNGRRASIGFVNPDDALDTSRVAETHERVLGSAGPAGGSSCLPCEVATGGVTAFRYGPTVALVESTDPSRAVTVDVAVPQPVSSSSGPTLAVAGQTTAVATALPAPAGTQAAVTFLARSGQVLPGSGRLTSVDGRPDSGGVLAVRSVGAGFVVTTTTTTTWYRPSATGDMTAVARYAATVAVPVRDEVVTSVAGPAPEALEVRSTPDGPSRRLNVGPLGGAPRPILAADSSASLLWILHSVEGATAEFRGWSVLDPAAAPARTVPIPSITAVDHVTATPGALLISGAGVLTSVPAKSPR